MESILSASIVPSGLEKRQDDIQEQETQSTPPSDIAGATAASPKKPWSFYLSILLTGLLGLVVALDSTSLAVTLPVIANQLHGTTFQSFWASISFLLAVAVTQPIYTSVSDVLGRKLPLYTSMIFFLIGSVIFASAKSMSVVIVGRLVMGFGGGGMDVLQVIILSDLTTLRERPLYMGIIAVFFSLGAISGPIVGGLFSEYVTWRWLGWMNLPIIGITFVLAFFFLNLKPIDMDFRTKISRLDWIGMALFASGTTCIALPLSWADSLYPWSSWKTILPLVVGLILLIILGLYEKKAVEPLFPYRILTNVTGAAAIASGFVHGLLMYTVLLYLPLFFQAAFLQTPLQAAISTLPLCTLIVAFSAISGVLISHIRQYRIVLLLGWFLTTIFLGLLCLVKRTTPLAEAYIFQSLVGIGMGVVLTVTAIPMQASVKHVDDTGLAAGMLVIFRLFGALLGLTIGSTVFTSVFQKNISTFAGLPEALEVLEDASKAVSFIPSLKTLILPNDEVLFKIIDVYQLSFRAVWIVMTCLAGVGFFAALFIQELTLEKDDVGRQGLQQQE